MVEAMCCECCECWWQVSVRRRESRWSRCESNERGKVDGRGGSAQVSLRFMQSFVVEDESCNDKLDRGGVVCRCGEVGANKTLARLELVSSEICEYCKAKL
jgi:hypothetical protein